MNKYIINYTSDYEVEYGVGGAYVYRMLKTIKQRNTARTVEANSAWEYSKELK